MTVVSAFRVPDLKSTSEADRAQLMVERLVALAQRIEHGASPNPTALLCIRNTKLSRNARLRYRANWVSRLIGRRRDTESPQIIELMEAAYALLVARQADLSDRHLARNRELGDRLARQLRRIQPGVKRLSHYCSRRTGPDTDLLAVEFFARALNWPYIDGTEDYLAAMYCICRRADLRYRLKADSAPKLAELAADWATACSAADEGCTSAEYRL